MKINRVLVTGRIAEELGRLLEDTPAETAPEFRYVKDVDVTESDFEWADAYVGFRPSPRFVPEKLKWVHVLAAGVDRFVYEREWNKDVLLTRTICDFGLKIGEYCLSYMLADQQHHSAYRLQQGEKQWLPKPYPVSMKDKKVVIFGTGAIGCKIGELAASFGARVYGVSRTGVSKPSFHQVTTLDKALEVLDGADWVINILPLTKDTAGLFDIRRFEKLQNAGFINVGRGATVNERDLLLALDLGHLRTAVLDVFATEPLPSDSVLWTRPDITITPHISGITSPEEAVKCFLDTWRRIEKEEPLPNQVDISIGY